MIASKTNTLEVDEVDRRSEGGGSRNITPRCAKFDVDRAPPRDGVFVVFGPTFQEHRVEQMRRQLQQCNGNTSRPNPRSKPLMTF